MAATLFMRALTLIICPCLCHTVASCDPCAASGGNAPETWKVAGGRAAQVLHGHAQCGRLALAQCANGCQPS